MKNSDPLSVIAAAIAVQRGILEDVNQPFPAADIDEHFEQAHLAVEELDRAGWQIVRKPLTLESEASNG